MKKYHIWNFNQNIFVLSNSKEGPPKDFFRKRDTDEAGFGILKRNGEIRTKFGTENMHDMWDAKNNHRDRDDGIEEP